MSRPLPIAFALGLLLALPACGKLKVVSVPAPGDEEAQEAKAPTARPVSESETRWASQLAFEACRSEIAKRMRVSETKVRTSTRAREAREDVDLVNWEVQGGAAGYCRVDSGGTVLNVETERSGPPRPAVAQQPTSPRDPAPAPAPVRQPREGDAGEGTEDGEPELPQVKRQQLDACRSAVIREMGARPDDVGLSAGTPDERGTVLIDWSLGSGREGTCLVDSGAIVVQFRK